MGSDASLASPSFGMPLRYFQQRTFFSSTEFELVDAVGTRLSKLRVPAMPQATNARLRWHDDPEKGHLVILTEGDPRRDGSDPAKHSAGAGSEDPEDPADPFKRRWLVAYTYLNRGFSDNATRYELFDADHPVASRKAHACVDVLSPTLKKAQFHVVVNVPVKAELEAKRGFTGFRSRLLSLPPDAQPAVDGHLPRPSRECQVSPAELGRIADAGFLTPKMRLKVQGFDGFDVPSLTMLAYVTSLMR